jgi:hypothetical protein
MTDAQRVAAISVNLLRISEWYAKDAAANMPLCQRFLQQSNVLARQIHSPNAQPYLRRLADLSLPGSEPVLHTAERFLTLGVLLQHPERWMVP